jgi:formylglycine-generating enzyme required for sulfatase activity
MKNVLKHTWLVLFLLMAGMMTASAQQKLKFSVESFELDQFDLTARNEAYKKMDGNGSLYAIIKVTSSNPDDNLRAYHFNFGNMNSLIDVHDGELWVYVQRNAKMVTISREGYTTVSRYDLQTTIEEGRTYTMRLTSQGPVVRKQMVMFNISPADSKAVVMVKGLGDAPEEVLSTNASGQLAKNMVLGTYTYRVMAENYYPSEGRFTLDSPTQTHQETVTLRSRFAMVTLTVSSDADILVDGEVKGRRTWTGALGAGSYQVECRQAGHRATQQSITVEEDVSRTYTLQAPSPITGMLSVISEPLGAHIAIDGKDYGTTPQNIDNLLVGSHEIKLSKAGYNDLTQAVTVKEGEMSEVSITLSNVPVLTDEKTFTVTGHGKTVTFKMKLVKAGIFQMGSKKGYDSEKPVHTVTLTKDYYMGETEVTQALWYAVMGQSPTSDGDKWESESGFGDNYPAYYISYDDCQQFLRRLNELTGEHFRMPTEAEWEYAAKGGQKSKGYRYAGSNKIGDVAWYDENSYNLGSSNPNYGTHAVKTKVANELGLYDMSGNVWEWCSDWYGSYSSSAQTNPTGAVSGSRRVSRGGSWYFDAGRCRASIRNYYSPSYWSFNIGFRFAL